MTSKRAARAARRQEVLATVAAAEATQAHRRHHHHHSHSPTEEPNRFTPLLPDGDPAEGPLSVSMLRTWIAANVLLTGCGMGFVLCNALATVAEVAFVVLAVRRLRVRPFVVVSSCVAALAACGGVASTCAAAWALHAHGMRYMLSLWAEVLIASTYPLHLAHLLASCALVWRELVAREAVERRAESDARERAWKEAEEDRPSLLRCYDIRAGRVVACLPEDARIHVHVNPSHEDLQRISEGLADCVQRVVAAAKDPDNQPRLELGRGGNVAALLKLPHRSPHGVLIDSVSIVLSRRKKLVVVMKDTFPLFDAGVCARCETERLEDAVIIALRRIIASVQESLNWINAEGERIEMELRHRVDTAILVQLSALQKSLFYLVDSAKANGEAIRHLQGCLRLSLAGREMLEELIADNDHCMFMSQTYSDVVGGLMGARIALINNNLGVMTKNLSAVTFAIMVPTFVTAWLGMSEFTTMAGGPEWKWLSYPLFVVVMVLVGVGTLVVLRLTERKWSGMRS
eukprot:m51a1_g2446 hypothetical protein (516) ;mRNA; r:873184-874917